MILRAAIVFLLVINLGVGAWWMGGGNGTRRPAASAMPAGVPGLRLVDEAAPAAPPATAGAPASASASASASATAAAPAPVVALAAPVEQCLRFGPFADDAARDAARTALAAAGVEAQPRQTPARPARGWKVHVPAFATREEANAMGEKIKAAGIADWYVMNAGGDANSIALGRYASEDAARRRESELTSKGIPAQAEPLGDTAAQAWLEARLPAAADRAALAAIAPAKAVDCAPRR